MKKITALFISFFVCIFAFMPLATVAAAPFDEVCNTGVSSSSSTVCQSKNNASNPISGPNGVIVKVIQFINLIIGVLAVFVIIISGLRMIASSGDPAIINSSRNGIMYALIGIAVAVTAQMIVTFVIKKL